MVRRSVQKIMDCDRLALVLNGVTQIMYLARHRVNMRGTLLESTVNSYISRFSVKTSMAMTVLTPCGNHSAALYPFPARPIWMTCALTAAIVRIYENEVLIWFHPRPQSGNEEI